MSQDRASSARRQGIALGEFLGKTITHFFPKIRSWMASLSDTRDQARITYPRQFLSWMGLMVFLLKVGCLTTGSLSGWVGVARLLITYPAKVRNVGRVREEPPVNPETHGFTEKV